MPPPASADSRAQGLDAPRFDLSQIDSAADPCGDFYQFACGRWVATHPIPAAKARVSRYDEMVDRNQAWTRELLDRVGDPRPSRLPIEQQVGDDYASCLDQSAIDSRGISPLRDDLDAIDRGLEKEQWAPLLGQLHVQRVNAPFSLYVDVDLVATDRVMIWLDAGGMGLSNRDDYLRDDPQSKALRANYKTYLTRIFALLGEPSLAASGDADRVLAIETALARAALDPLALRNLQRQYHPMSIGEIERLAPAIGWRQYFARLGVQDEALIVNVAVPGFLTAISGIISSHDRRAWRAYLAWHLVHRSTPVLPSSFAKAEFDFYGAASRGVQQMAPRWNHCLRLVNEHLGEAVGQLFVRAHFRPESRARVREIIEAVRAALRRELKGVAWLGQSTREEALRKLDAVTVKIGHPERWRDYTGLRIDRANAYENARRAREFEFRRQLSKLNRPTDRAEWDTPPQDLDGYSTKVLNEIAFTAGILQRPFFDRTADEPLQFGALGAVAGHEIIHLFDDEGRKYDAHGGLRDWWAPDDARRYAELSRCFVDEYSHETAVDDLHLNGELTLGENLADNGGLRLSYRALKPREDGPLIDGFTPAQRFFLAWAQIRCENVTDADLRRRTQSDGHSPGRFRVNVVVSNMTEFTSAFRCQENAPMARKARCVLW